MQANSLPTRAFVSPFPRLSIYLPRLSSPSFGKILLLALAVAAICYPTTANAQAVSFSGQLISFGTGFDDPQGVAVDVNGNIYVADSDNNAVKEILAVNGVIPPVNPTIVTLGSGFSDPQGVAVDASGDVFVADTNNGLVKEMIAVNGSIPKSPVINVLGGNTFVAPSSVAVDSKGNVFVADIQLYEIVKAGGYATVTVLGAAFDFGPTAVAVDSSGNVYDADSNGGVFELLASNSFKTVKKLDGGFTDLLGIAVDTQGDVYFTQAGTAAVEELVAVGGVVPATPTVLTITMGSEYSYVQGLAVDKDGHVYVSNIESNQLVKLQSEKLVYYGNVDVCPSAQAEPAGCANSLTLSYNVSASGSLGTPRVLTTGQPDVDFTLASGNTCTGEVTAGITCTVSVTFAPIAPGSRKGAVQILSSTGAVLATTYVYGNGIGPAVAVNVGASSVMTGSFIKPWGTVIDAAGNLYSADVDAGTILKVPAAGGAAQTIATGLNSPMQLALDGIGNLYVGLNGTNSSIVEIPAGCTTSSCRLSVGTGFTAAGGVAVDPDGDVFVSDYLKGSVVEVPVGCTSAACQITLATRGINGGHAMTIDSAGDLFVAQYAAGGVIEIPAGCSALSCQKTIGSGFQGAMGVAVDAAGDVYVADFLGRHAYQVTPAGVQTVIGSPAYPVGVAVDGAGDVYVTGQGQTGASIYGVIEKLPRSTPAALAFPNTTVGSSTTESLVVQNVGNSSLVESGLTIGAGWSQVAGSGSPADCKASSTFAPGTSCNLSLSFKPTTVSTYSGAVTLTNNALNGSPATEQITLSGSGIAK